VPSAAVAAAAVAATRPQTQSTLWPRTRHFIAGCASGAALVMVGHPFDLVKVRLQTEGASGRFSGPLQCVAATVRTEGLLSLYKGVTPPLLGTGIINALVFGLQGTFVGMAKSRDGTPASAPATLGQTVQAAMATGAIISLVVTPIEGIKSRLQVQYHALGAKAATAGAHGPAPLYTGPRSCIAYVLRHQGVAGLYRGLLPVVFCRMSNWAYFGGYHFWKGVYARMVPNSGGDSQKPTKAAAVFSGGLDGISYWFSCYPMDVIKARMMAQHTEETRTVRSTARMIMARDGWKGFFAGFTPCLARAFPANAAAFLAFEWTMSLLPE